MIKFYKLKSMQIYRIKHADYNHVNFIALRQTLGVEKLKAREAILFEFFAILSEICNILKLIKGQWQVLEAQKLVEIKSNACWLQPYQLYFSATKISGRKI